jgi:hypothetical protein
MRRFARGPHHHAWRARGAVSNPTRALTGQLCPLGLRRRRRRSRSRVRRPIGPAKRGPRRPPPVNPNPVACVARTLIAFSFFAVVRSRLISRRRRRWEHSRCCCEPSPERAPLNKPPPGRRRRRRDNISSFILVSAVAASCVRCRARHSVCNQNWGPPPLGGVGLASARDARVRPCRRRGARPSELPLSATAASRLNGNKRHSSCERPLIGFVSSSV